MEDLLGFIRPAFQVVTRPEGSRNDLNVQLPSECIVSFVRVSL